MFRARWMAAGAGMDGRLVAFLARVVPGSALVLGVGSLIRQQLTPACYNQPIIPERYRVADDLRRPLADMVAAAELRRAAPTAACAASTHHLAIDSDSWPATRGWMHPRRPDEAGNRQPRAASPERTKGEDA
jgi:hypothetical protein